VCDGEAPWVRRNGARLGLLGRGCEHGEALVLPLRHGDQLVGVLVAAHDSGGINDSQLHRLGDLAEPAALALATTSERARRAESETRAADLFLAIGSSLVVYPAAGFPQLAKRNGAMLAIINREATPLDPLADLVLNRAIGETLGAAVGAA
jgi:GAF domain-containing protein